jgi:UDP-N-acetylglucosamine 1-carboxyvinyltransferase
MDKLIIEGPSYLKGELRVSRAKNAYLPILAAVLLNDKKIELENIPALRDIATMRKLLTNLGVKVEDKENSSVFDASNITSYEATYDLVKTMRASICVLGPLLSRFGYAKVSLPGGCAIGTRPIDLHLSNLEKMGAEITVTGGYVEAKTKKLKGAHLILDFPSVGATENLMMAAVFADGLTVIENAALEPEVSDLANFLVAMGAKISGIDSKTIKIEGVSSLQAVRYEAIGDRIEAGTYLMAALMSQSDVRLTGIIPQHLDFVIEKLKEMGAKIETGKNWIHVSPSTLNPTTIETAPYPGFPTDLQAQMMALLVTVKGPSIITETIFENRYMHVPELVRLGADIELNGNTAVIKGGEVLVGAPVMCTDLRASAALVLAALVAQGPTEIQRVYHLDRGYEKLDEKLRQIGAKISRQNDQA